VRGVLVVALVGLVAVTTCSPDESRQAQATATSRVTTSTTPSKAHRVHTGHRRPQRVDGPGRMRTCGAWVESRSATGKALRAAHGPIKNCLGLDRTWFVFQLGGQGRDGGVEEFRCPTARCAPSKLSFQLSRWRYLRPPLPGGVTLLDAESPRSWSVDVAGHELLFHPATGTFTQE
jgi:hypothetical protein